MEQEMDLKNVLKIIWDRKIGIIIIILLCLIIGVVYTKFFTVPIYEASTTVILAKEDITQSELTLNDKLVGTYSEIAKSSTVLGEVINNLGIKNISEEELRNQIEVTSGKNAQSIKISVENSDPNLAAKIANETTSVFSKKAAEVYNMDNIYTLDNAEVPDAPNNINHGKDILMFLAGGILLSIVYVVVSSLLDNTIKTSRDVEKYTSLTVLAEIPICDFTNEKGRKK